MAKKVKSSSSITLTQFLKGKVLYDNVVVRPLVQEKVTAGDVEIVRPQDYGDKPEFGEVLMVGEGRVFDNGTVIPLKVKVGDKVYFQKYSQQKVRLNGEELSIIREEDIYWHE